MSGPRERFPSSARLRRSKDFQRVARTGRRVVSTHFIVLVAPQRKVDDGATARLGVTVSRRVGSAVTRNRVKRRIREWFRRKRPHLDSHLDVVVIARPVAACVPGPEVDRELSGALEQCR